MALIPQNSEDSLTSESSYLNDGISEQFENASMPKSKPLELGSRTSKNEALMNPNLVQTTEKNAFLEKIKNPPGKPHLVNKYRVEKLKPKSSKKPRSPRSPRMMQKRKQPVVMSDEDNKLTPRNSDDDLTPRNNDRQNSSDILTESNDEDSFSLLYDDLSPLWNYEDKDDDKEIMELRDNDDISPIWSDEDQSTSENSEELPTIRVYSAPSMDESLNEFLYVEAQSGIDETFDWHKYNAAQLSDKDDSELEEASSSTSFDYEDTPGFRTQQTSTDDLFKLQKVSLVSGKVPEPKTAFVNPNISSSGGRDLNRIGRVVPHMHTYLPSIPEEPEEPEVPYRSYITRNQLGQLRDERNALEMERLREETKLLMELSDQLFSYYEEHRKPAEYYAIKTHNKKKSFVLILLNLTILVLLVMSSLSLYWKHASNISKTTPKVTTLTLWWQYFCKQAQVLYFYK